MIAKDSKGDKKTSKESQQEKSPHYLGHRSRLRKKILSPYINSMSDYEILEFLLFSSRLRGDVKPIAKKLLEYFGDLGNIVNADPGMLKKFKGVGESSISVLRVVQEISCRVLRSKIKNIPLLNDWKSLLDYCRASMGYLKSEQFRIFYLDSKNHLIADELQAKGTIDQTPVYPREVVKRALELSAAAIIMVHNHPSGDVKPSKPDIVMTNKVCLAMETVNIKVHDHLIVGLNDHYSFRSNGWIT